ncbi:MAG TPA: ATP-dependent Clp protease proteolytic subunit [Terriglobia bacterium]|nr:ATP-dependent Clp protease proteolytic subunit [Terriglobia bacterium]
MSKPHPYYRLNPARSIHLVGLIDQDLVSRVTPHILKLQAQSRDPITVYIDSNGGQPLAAETILNVLRMTDQDGAEPCHIITAVTTKALSAAADLLSSGDYAVAYPHSLIHYHGLRTAEPNLLTAEYSSRLAAYLRQRNDQYALELAQKIDDRFSFRFVSHLSEYVTIRSQPGKQHLSDLDCFIEFIGGKLSPEGTEIWERAKQRHSRYAQLFYTVMRKVRSSSGPRARAKLEAFAIKAIADFEVKANKDNPRWSFRGGGIERLTEDFFLFNEYVTNFSGDRLQRWSADWGKIAVPADRMAEIDAIQDEQAKKTALESEIRSILEPLTAFFAALCHALQEGENQLTATDAYWLGLIDEVIGKDDLFCQRHIEEWDNEKGKQEDQPKELPETTGTGAGPSQD